MFKTLAGLLLIQAGCSSTPQTQVVYVEVAADAALLPSEASNPLATASSPDATPPDAAAIVAAALASDGGIHVSELDASFCGCAQHFSNVTYNCYGQAAGCFEYDPCAPDPGNDPHVHACGPLMHEDDATGAEVPIVCPPCAAGWYCYGGPYSANCYANGEPL